MDYGKRQTEEIPLLNDGMGISSCLKYHKYGPKSEDVDLCYLQASLHADELPGILVNHHLLKMLDDCTERIKKRIHIMAYANPYGLNQSVLGDVQGRFNIQTGVNFNRGFPDVSKTICSTEARLVDKLVEGDALYNTKVVRKEVRKQILSLLEDPYCSTEKYLKLQLLVRASQANIVLDLHCDAIAQLHLYTHRDIWNASSAEPGTCIMQTLAAELQASPVLVSSGVGEECCFDDVCSNVFYQAHRLVGEPSGRPVGMGCKSCTVELRGNRDVSDVTARQDAEAIFRFLQSQGYIDDVISRPPTPALLREATELAAADFVPAPAGGIIEWKAQVGGWVSKGDVIAEIISVEDVDAARVNVVSRTSGQVFARRAHALVKRGQIIIKIAGETVLKHRTGQMLTS